MTGPCAPCIQDTCIHEGGFQAYTRPVAMGLHCGCPWLPPLWRKATLATLLLHILHPHWHSHWHPHWHSHWHSHWHPHWSPAVAHTGSQHDRVLHTTKSFDPIPALCAHLMPPCCIIIIGIMPMPGIPPIIAIPGRSISERLQTSSRQVWWSTRLS